MRVGISVEKKIYKRKDEIENLGEGGKRRQDRICERLQKEERVKGRRGEEREYRQFRISIWGTGKRGKANEQDGNKR